MNLQKTVIRIGLETPFRALHLSDTHFCLTNESDPPRVRELGERRTVDFEGQDTGCIRRYWEEAVSYARAEGLPILHTGDLLDFLSFGNAEAAKQIMQENDIFFATGNHEFCHYVGEAREDLSYKMEQLPKIQPSFPDPMLFASRVIGGVNFVAVDDGYYLFTDWQRERLMHEAAKGLPIVLMLHNPLHTDKLYSVMMNEKRQPCAYLTGTPEDMRACYPEYRRIQQCPDEPTLRFIDYATHEPAVRAILAGHLHFSWDGLLPSGTPMYVTGGGYEGYAREIEFI